MPYSLTLAGSLVEDMTFPRGFRPCPRAGRGWLHDDGSRGWNGVRSRARYSRRGVGPPRTAVVPHRFDSRCSRALPIDGDGEVRSVTFAVVVPGFRPPANGGRDGLSGAGLRRPVLPKACATTAPAAWTGGADKTGPPSYTNAHLRPRNARVLRKGYPRYRQGDVSPNNTTRSMQPPVRWGEGAGHRRNSFVRL